LRRSGAEETAVGKSGDAIGETLGERTFVSDHDDGHAEGFLDFLKEEKDSFAVGTVEIAGGLVGKKDGGAIDECASESAALLFAAGEFAGAMLAASGETNAVESFGDAGFALRAIDLGEAKREFDIFFESHAGEKIEGLEDHADGLAAVTGEGFGGNFSEVEIVDDDGAERGAVESSEEAEESGFARAGAAEESEEFAGEDGEGDVINGANGGFAEMVFAGDVLGVD
jgi:hypothetical protein